MVRVLLVVLGVFAFCLPLACRRDTEPPPRFPELSGVYGAPVRVFDRVGDRSIIGSVPREEDSSPERGSTEAAAPEAGAEAAMPEVTSVTVDKKVEEKGKEETPEEPKPVAAEPKQRERDEVDDVFSGPDMLRRGR